MMLMRVLFFITLVLSTDGFAATVQSIKNEKMLISLDGQSMRTGEKYFLLNSQGKKKAVIRIRQVKDDRAIAEVLKGQAEVGFKLSQQAVKDTVTKPTMPSPEQVSYKRINSQAGNSWGLLGSQLSSQMQADFIPAGSSSRTSVAMKGTSFGILGFYDYSHTPEIQFRALLGLEQFKVSGNSNGATDCDGSSDCNVNLTYLSSYGGFKYYFYRQKFKIWAGGYYGFLVALSKSSSVLRTADLTSNQLWVFSAGLDYPLKKGTFIPASIDYGLFPASATVKSNVLFIRAGWGTEF